MSSNYLRVTSGREGTGVPSKCDWMKADSQELDLVDEDMLSGVILAPHLTSSQASTWVKPPQVGHVPLTI